MPKARGDRPRYLKPQRNRDGTVRWYWRPKDRPSVALGSDESTAVLEAIRLNRQRDAERAGLAGPTPPAWGSVRAMADAYKASPEFTGLAPKTRREYDRHLSWLLDLFGDLPVAAVTARAVQELKRAGAGTPWETNARLRTVRLLWSWGRLQGMASGDNPAASFRQLDTPARDVVWSSEEVAAFLRDGTPSIRLAVALGLYTLQREGDLIALTWNAVRGDRVELRQRKTGKLVATELHPVLRAALAVTERRAAQVLVSEATGRPYGEDHFRHVFAYDRARLGLRRELQFRDLRRTGAVSLARIGVSTARIAALGGWEISRAQAILETYIPLDEEMASAAVREWSEHG